MLALGERGSAFFLSPTQVTVDLADVCSSPVSRLFLVAPRLEA